MRQIILACVVILLTFGAYQCGVVTGQSRERANAKFEAARAAIMGETEAGREQEHRSETAIDRWNAAVEKARTADRRAGGGAAGMQISITTSCRTWSSSIARCGR